MNQILLNRSTTSNIRNINVINEKIFQAKKDMLNNRLLTYDNKKINHITNKYINEYVSKGFKEKFLELAKLYGNDSIHKPYEKSRRSNTNIMSLLLPKNINYGNRKYEIKRDIFSKINMDYQPKRENRFEFIKYNTFKDLKEFNMPNTYNRCRTPVLGQGLKRNFSFGVNKMY
ncbi:MAG: hypothetical protein MJ252_04090 [archaeon]|nr:hypothetical protein [archaeon]